MQVVICYLPTAQRYILNQNEVVNKINMEIDGKCNFVIIKELDTITLLMKFEINSADIRKRKKVVEIYKRQKNS